MRGARRDAVEAYIREEEARSGPLFVLGHEPFGVVCILVRNQVFAVGLEDEPLELGVRKHLRRLGQVYPDQASAIAALGTPRTSGEGA
jgi:hypothetical protein